jgi:DNA-directed RNA polymerase specialized sigma24 family protein
MEQLGFDEFYRAHWREAARWAAAVVGRVDIGEEVAQDVFARLAGRYAALENPVGYLRRAIVNAGRSWLRSEARSRSRESRAGSVSVPVDGGVSADTSTLAALDGLGERQRLVVILRYWADWPDHDIAAALECPASTVRSLARRGLTHLREELS